MTPQAKDTLTALIVDDEAPAREVLAAQLALLPELELIGEGDAGREAPRLIRDNRPDLVFLDVQMPDQSGFDVLAALDENKLPAIIFLTGRDSFAFRAFEVSGVDHLLKPVDEKQLGNAVRRLLTRSGMRQARSRLRRLKKLLGSMDSARRSGLGSAKTGAQASSSAAQLAIRDGGKTTWLAQEDIDWIDAAGDYMCIHAGGQTHIMRKTMKALEQELSADCLQRIHRSTIINVNRVTGMRRHINGEYFLDLEGGHTVKLSRSYRDKLQYLK